MNEKQFWQFAADSINDNYKLVLLTVAESSEHSPGRQGFKMLVRDDKVIKGTIGGGIMEKDLVDYSLDLIAGNESQSIKRLQHTDKTDRESSGLICGGYQTIILSMLGENELPTIEKILHNLSNRTDGTLKLTPGKISYDVSSAQENECEFVFTNEDDYSYTENVGLTDTAYVVGGGHVGLAVSQAMKFIGFYVVVFDHRDDVFTMKQNVYADEKIIADYKTVNQYIKEGSKSYVIIVTPKHAGDKDALGSVINMDVKYIGMMGSKRKIKTVFNNLVKEGISKGLFDKVHTPIGIEINAETPAEIAVSIASEIIQIKRG